MKNTTLLLACCCAALGSCAMRRAEGSPPPPPLPADGSHFNVDGHLGYRSIQGSGWQGSHDQAVAGVSADYTPRSFPIGFEGAIFGSSRYHENPGPDSFDTLSDLSAGLRKTVAFSPTFRAYIGAGGTAIWARQSHWTGSGNSHISDDDSSWAWYGHAGAYFRLADRFNVGIDGRTTQNSELTIFGQNADADLWQVTLFFGWGW